MSGSIPHGNTFSEPPSMRARERCPVFLPIDPRFGDNLSLSCGPRQRALRSLQDTKFAKAADLDEVPTDAPISVDFRSRSEDHNCDIDYLYSNILYVKEFGSFLESVGAIVLRLGRVTRKNKAGRRYGCRRLVGVAGVRYLESVIRSIRSNETG
jgi:hypothetical protein